MKLASGRVLIRSMNRNDFPLLYSEMEFDSDYLRKSDTLWLPHNDESLMEALEFQLHQEDESGFPTSFVIENEKHQSIGLLSVHSFDRKHKVFSYGISLLTPYQKKGYAYESARLLLYYMLFYQDFYKCQASTYHFNQSSIALQEKLGFAQEAVLENGYYSDGQFHHIYVWGMTKTQYSQKHGNVKIEYFSKVRDLKY